MNYKNNEDNEDEEIMDDEDKRELQMARIAELVAQGYTSGQEADFAWDLTINQL